MRNTSACSEVLSVELKLRSTETVHSLLFTGRPLKDHVVIQQLRSSCDEKVVRLRKLQKTAITLLHDVVNLQLEQVNCSEAGDIPDTRILISFFFLWKEYMQETASHELSSIALVPVG